MTAVADELEGPVCLTQSASDQQTAGTYSFYDLFHPRAFEKSGVLSCIVEAGGNATLPETVTLSDLKAWNKATNSEEAELDKMEFIQACSVLKVADVLDDEDVNEWLHRAAGILVSHACPASSKEEVSQPIKPKATNKPQLPVPHLSVDAMNPGDVSAILSALPDHLQHRLFEQATLEPRNIKGLIAMLPSHHHAALVAATISPDKAMQARFTNMSSLYTAAVTSLPASPPSIDSLAVENDFPALENDFLWSLTDDSSHLEASYLADILRHHSSLTSLSLPMFSSAFTPTPLVPAIATLTSLKTISIAGNSDDIQMLKPALPSLSSLQGIRMNLFTPLTPRKRCYDEEAVYCLSGVLSDFTALTSLHIHQDCDYAMFAATAPLVLPSLVEFQLHTQAQSDDTHILGQLVAPLTSLQVNRSVESSHHLKDVPSAQRLCSSLQRFVQLRRLSIELDICPWEGCGDDPAVFQALLISAPAALARLSRLRELDLKAPIELALPIMQQIAAHATGLHCLMLQLNPFGRGENLLTRETWGQLVSHISRFSLKRLDLRPGYVTAAPGVAALGWQAQLTSLHMDGWHSCLATAADCGALAQMTQLRSVCMVGTRESEEGEESEESEEIFTQPHAQDTYAGWVHALGALPALTQLALQGPDGFMAAFAAHALEVPWPALQWLGVFVTKDVAEGVVKAVAQFPSVQDIVVDAVDLRYGERDEDSDSEEDTIHMDPETWARVASIARGAGVQLTKGWRGPPSVEERFYAF